MLDEEDEDEEEPQEENVGQWSPRALDPEHVQSSEDVIPDEEDARLLELLRAQVGGPAELASLPELGQLDGRLVPVARPLMPPVGLLPRERPSRQPGAACGCAHQCTCERP